MCVVYDRIDKKIVRHKQITLLTTDDLLQNRGTTVFNTLFPENVRFCLAITGDSREVLRPCFYARISSSCLHCVSSFNG